MYTRIGTNWRDGSCADWHSWKFWTPLDNYRNYQVRSPRRRDLAFPEGSTSWRRQWTLIAMIDYHYLRCDALRYRVLQYRCSACISSKYKNKKPSPRREIPEEGIPDEKSLLKDPIRGQTFEEPHVWCLMRDAASSFDDTQRSSPFRGTLLSSRDYLRFRDGGNDVIFVGFIVQAGPSGYLSLNGRTCRGVKGLARSAKIQATFCRRRTAWLLWSLSSLILPKASRDFRSVMAEDYARRGGNVKRRMCAEVSVIRWGVFGCTKRER